MIKRPSHVCSCLSIDKVPPTLTTLPKELLPKRAHSQSHDRAWRGCKEKGITSGVYQPLINVAQLATLNRPIGLVVWRKLPIKI